MSAASTATWLPPRGTHNVLIGSSMRRSLTTAKPERAQGAQPSRNDFVAMRYNFKPQGVANATGSLVPTGAYAQKDSYQLELSSDTGEQHSFNARSEPKKEVDCVLFYDPSTGTLVLERLDSLLTLTHQHSTKPPTKPVQHLSSGTNTRLLHNRPSPTPGPATTAFPPTPPSTSPPDYSALPESTRLKEKDLSADILHAGRDHATPIDLSGDPGADKEPVSSSASASTPASLTSSSGRKIPQTMSDYAQEKRRLQESSTPQAGKRASPDFESDPEEEVLTFGKPATPSSSNNALHLSDVPYANRAAKRKFCDSDPDEELLEFGRPPQEIKRAKTNSPASVSYGASPQAATWHSDSAPSPSGIPPLNMTVQSVSSRSSAALAPNKLLHGSSPLAQAQVLSSSESEDEEEDDDDSDSEPEKEAPSYVPSTYNHMEAVYEDPVGDGDADDDDFLAAAFKEEGDLIQNDAEDNDSGDSSDDSDYDER
ncbi:hypothetical protein FRC14_003838 [Serendipita sp. 396]|nr:hypothetical protein FRC14_003838 [Serendipita sp. 396]KAG8789443.1 hypothetical protein FRC15_008300 [Serendipita sp. 397]KAG8804675.1 hypothetical protein FRC16_003565 [Serendipita sp. 398]KAG8852419.1 hypothetical protein FRB91_006545 [Serendipita sp. 411]KAG8879027.1 hypothetical protein FRC20_003786 [Serendipita sp. 405]